MLQVGRSTLREAVRMLSSRNILTVRHGSGIYVSDQLGLSDDPLGFIFVKDKLKLVHDLVDFRLMFEPRIASMAAMVAAPKDVEQLQKAELKVEKRIKLKENHSREDLNFTALLPRSQAISSSLNLSPFFLRQ